METSVHLTTPRIVSGSLENDPKMFMSLIITAILECEVQNTPATQVSLVSTASAATYKILFVCGPNDKISRKQFNLDQFMEPFAAVTPRRFIWPGYSEPAIRLYDRWIIETQTSYYNSDGYDIVVIQHSPSSVLLAPKLTSEMLIGDNVLANIDEYGGPSSEIRKQKFVFDTAAPVKKHCYYAKRGIDFMLRRAVTGIKTQTNLPHGAHKWQKTASAPTSLLCRLCGFYLFDYMYNDTCKFCAYASAFNLNDTGRTIRDALEYYGYDAESVEIFEELHKTPWTEVDSFKGYRIKKMKQMKISHAKKLVFMQDPLKRINTSIYKLSGYKIILHK